MGSKNFPMEWQMVMYGEFTLMRANAQKMLELEDLVPEFASCFGVVGKRGFLPSQFALHCSGHEHFFFDPRQGCFEPRVHVATGCADGGEVGVFMYLCRGTVVFFRGNFPIVFLRWRNSPPPRAVFSLFPDVFVAVGRAPAERPFAGV